MKMYPLLKKPDLPQISESDAWKDDPFDRKRDAEMLSRLIASSITDPLVLSLQAPWGSGKTTFLKRLQVHIRSEFAIPSISIDAWKNDESQDPLVTIISEIKLSLEKESTRSKGTSTKDAIGKAITSMAQHGAKLVLPAVAVVAEFMAPGTGVGAATAGAGDLGERLLDAQDEKRKAEPDFRDALTEARDLLARRKKNGPVQPMLLIIDELDRCRPDYAIRMLERIKHYFDVPGVTFLIATDRGNLPSAVQTVYGAHVEGELYLRKFFDYEFHLSAPCVSTYAKHVIAKHVMPNVEPIERETIRIFPCYYSKFNDQITKIPIANLNKREYLEHFPAMVSAMNLSLRDTGQALTMLAAFVHSRDEGAAIIPIVDCFVSCLRFGHPTGFRLLIEESLLFSPEKTDPPWLQDFYNRLAKTEQWEAITAFLGERSNFMRALVSQRNGYDDEDPAQWQKILGGIARSGVSNATQCHQAVIAIRVRAAGEIDPWRYAREFVRLTPPLAPNPDPAG
jgi:hypothetical protein